MGTRMTQRLIDSDDTFDPESVAALNEASYGNPRRLLELADRAIAYGVTHRPYRVDVEIVRAALAPKKGRPDSDDPGPMIGPPRPLPAPAPELPVSAPAGRVPGAADSKDQDWDPPPYPSPEWGVSTATAALIACSAMSAA